MFAVIFEVNPHQTHRDDYLGHASLLRPELLRIDGFIANERFASHFRPGWLVSLSVWQHEKALIRWRTHALHNEIQGKGRSSVFADYHLRVGEITADTDLEPGRVLVQQRFDTTETGPAKAVLLTERPFEAARPPAAPRQVEADVFHSITRPGHGLYLTSWLDPGSAEAAAHGTPGRHRLVRIIRDYGMFAREEAPQYYPPVQRSQTSPAQTSPSHTS